MLILLINSIDGRDILMPVFISIGNIVAVAMSRPIVTIIYLKIYRFPSYGILR